MICLAGKRVLLLPVHKIGEFGVSFDETGNERAAGDNLPRLLSSLIQREPHQHGRYSSPAKLVGDIGVLQADPRAISGIAKNCEMSVHLHLKAQLRCVVLNRGRSRFCGHDETGC